MVSGQRLVVFNEDLSGQNVSGLMEMYEDKTGTAGIAEVLDSKTVFAPHSQPVPQFFSTNSAIWLKVNLRIETPDPVYFQFDYPMMDTIELYTIGSSGEVLEHKITGSFMPINTRELFGVYPKFRLQMGLYTYYIRVKSTYCLQLPIRIFSHVSLHQSRLADNLLQGGYMGFAVLIVFYTLFLLVSLKDKLYLFYILHIISSAIIIMHMWGYGFYALWPQSPMVNHFEPSIFGLVIFSTLFTIIFLETKTKYIQLHRWLIGSLIVNMLVFPLDWMGYHRIANYLVQVVVVGGCLIMLVGGVLSYMRGQKAARIFLLAWTFFLVGAIITILQRVGILPYNLLLMHAFQIGSALDMVLLALALADRINILSEEKEKAKEEVYQKITENDELVRKQNALLSLKVEERTREKIEQTELLEKQKKQLQELITTKDKIFSVIAHDLRGPLGNVSQLANMMADDTNLRNDETVALLRDASKRSFDLLDSLLLWAKSQFGETEFKKTKVDLNELAQNTLNLYYLKIKAKDITILNQIPVGLMANADNDMIGTVIRNLISNALKFTLVGGTIQLGGTEDVVNNTVVFWVRDSGLGIDADKIDAIFEAGKNKSLMGTDGETGTGLGLVICKDFVERNGGTIEAKSKKGSGSIFTVTLPGYSI